MSLRLIDYDDYPGYFTIEDDSDLHLFMSHTMPRILRDGGRPDGSLKMFAIVEEFKDIGLLWLEDITAIDGKLGIYIISEEHRGKGLGEKAIREVLGLAFDELHLMKVYLNVRATNTRAINCYRKCGFKIVEEYEKQRFVDGSIQSAYKLECLA